LISEFEVRNRLADLVNDEASVDSFERWLLRQSWNMHLGGSQAAQDLVSEIELHLAEYSNGHLSKDALFSELSSLLETIVVLDIGRSQITSTTSDLLSPISAEPRLSV
jgi:hypothetical protein